MAVSGDSLVELDGPVPAGAAAATAITLSFWGTPDALIRLNNAFAGSPRFSIGLVGPNSLGGDASWQSPGHFVSSITDAVGGFTYPTMGWMNIILCFAVLSTAGLGVPSFVSGALCAQQFGIDGDQFFTNTKTDNVFENISEITGDPWIMEFFGSGIDWVSIINTQFDLSVAGNRRLFNDVVNGQLCPVDPTPLTPILLFQGDDPLFAINRADATVWVPGGGGSLITVDPPCAARSSGSVTVTSAPAIPTSIKLGLACERQVRLGF